LPILQFLEPRPGVLKLGQRVIHQNLRLLIGDRIGTTVVYEPLVPGAGGINPAGIVGWFAYRRVGADTPTATALRVHNNA
jgi:hypothetical protein